MATAPTNSRPARTFAHDIVWWWFLLSSLVVLWDAGYCLLRPRSMEGGDLAWIWKPYIRYTTIDLTYGWEAFNNNEGFTGAQAAMNVIETTINFIYLYLGSDAPLAPLVGFLASSMTLSKTILYMLREYYCGWCGVRQNDLETLIFLWIFPNVLWILLPTIIMYILGKDLAASLRIAHRVQNARKVE
ncbi:hypothetical protein FRB94_001106 [Tulasnella sp. JGI-2019a]|nr:hypothetical protein FRB94_001106 [Tulasnella sp. JGI-2019a]